MNEIPKNLMNQVRLHLNEPWERLPDVLSTYPDSTSLRLGLADGLGVPPDCVLITAGADQALDAVVRAVGGPTICLDPDFERYVEHVENANLPVTKIAVPANGAIFPADEIRDAAKDAKLLIVAKRGNPTGYETHEGFLASLVEAFPHLVIGIDDCYADLVGVAHHGWAASTPNVVAIGSFSKRGFPALRIGFAVARLEMINKLRRFVSPFAVSGLSLDAALGLLRDPTFPARVKAAIARQLAARDYLARELQRRGFEIARPAGNWVLVKVGPGARKLAEEMKRRDIPVLVKAPMHPDLAEWIRVSTPNSDAMVVFIRAFDEILAGAIKVDNDLFRLRDDYRQPDRWIGAPFIFSVDGRIFEVDHVAVTLPNAEAHHTFMKQLQGAGAQVVEGPGVWPDEFCDDPTITRPDLAMIFATAKLPGGLLVVAAPNKPGAQLDRFRNDRGGDAVHHIALRADDINRVARDLAAEGWRPMTPNPVADGELAQWFLKNGAGQILELIARPVGGNATFTCRNIAGLRAAEVRK